MKLYKKNSKQRNLYIELSTCECMHISVQLVVAFLTVRYLRELFHYDSTLKSPNKARMSRPYYEQESIQKSKKD